MNLRLGCLNIKSDFCFFADKMAEIVGIENVSDTYFKVITKNGAKVLREMGAAEFADTMKKLPIPDLVVRCEHVFKLFNRRGGAELIYEYSDLKRENISVIRRGTYWHFALITRAKVYVAEMSERDRQILFDAI